MNKILFAVLSMLCSLTLFTSCEGNKEYIRVESVRWWYYYGDWQTTDLSFKVKNHTDRPIQYMRISMWIEKDEDIYFYGAFDIGSRIDNTQMKLMPGTGWTPSVPGYVPLVLLRSDEYEITFRVSNVYYWVGSH